VQDAVSGCYAGASDTQLSLLILWTASVSSSEYSDSVGQ
jgi:hypothetical protein